MIYTAKQGSQIALVVVLLLASMIACAPNAANPSDEVLDPTWLRTFGTGWSMAVAATPYSDDSFMVLGNSQPDAENSEYAWLKQLNDKGEVLQELNFWHEERGVAAGLVTVPSGGWVVSGKIVEGDKTLGALIAIDKSGAVRWQQSYGDYELQSSKALVRDGDGNLIFAGLTLGHDVTHTRGWIVKTDADGALLWQRHLEHGEADAFRALAVDIDGNIAAAGYTGPTAEQDRDGWVVLLDKDGTLIWEVTPPGVRQDAFHALTADRSGGFVAAGKTFSKGMGDFDQWVVAFDSKGLMKWESVIGGESCECATAILQEGSDRYILAGWTQTFGAGGYDIWLSALDGHGEFLWRRYFGGANMDEASAIVAAPAGGYFSAGSSLSFSESPGELVGFAALFVP